MNKRSTVTGALLAGLLTGLALYHATLVVAGRTTVDQEVLAAQRARIELLEHENTALTEELFRPRIPGEVVQSGIELPYDEQSDAASVVRLARTKAKAERRFLMVIFGANWCLDCRTLHHNLNSPPVSAYTRDLFHFVNVDIGNFNRNHDVAESLGVSLTRGIPVAIVFNPDGEVIGTTNEGQLEPARHYSSKQILKFVRDIAERSRIDAPDSVD